MPGMTKASQGVMQVAGQLGRGFRPEQEGSEGGDKCRGRKTVERLGWREAAAERRRWLVGLQQARGSSGARNGCDGWPVDKARISVGKTDSAVIEGGQEGVERTNGGMGFGMTDPIRDRGNQVGDPWLLV